MPQHIEKDPTEFFSVVGAPYIRERREESRRNRSWKIGHRAAVALLVCAVGFGVVLSAASGVAKLVEVAQYVKK